MKKTLDEQTARMKAIKRLYDSSAAFQSLKPVYEDVYKRQRGMNAEMRNEYLDRNGRTIQRMDILMNELGELMLVVDVYKRQDRRLSNEFFPSKKP